MHVMGAAPGEHVEVVGLERSNKYEHGKVRLRFLK
jgi:hypothetical protein